METGLRRSRARERILNSTSTPTAAVSLSAKR